MKTKILQTCFARNVSDYESYPPGFKRYIRRILVIAYANSQGRLTPEEVLSLQLDAVFEKYKREKRQESDE